MDYLYMLHVCIVTLDCYITARDAAAQGLIAWLTWFWTGWLKVMYKKDDERQPIFTGYKISISSLTVWEISNILYRTNIFYQVLVRVVLRLIMSIRRGHLVFSSLSQRPITSDFKGFPTKILSITWNSPILILEKEPVFPF